MDAKTITERLSAPFDPALLKWRPGATTQDKSKAQALAYIDARLVQDRLDDVLGVDGWQDNYEMLPDGNVVCRLQLKIGGEWITKTDIGGQSEQPDDGDKLKAAFSDALKRAAVKFGIGRFLYRLPTQWVALNERKQFATKPVAPAWYLAEWEKRQPQPAQPQPQPQPQQPAPAKPVNGKATKPAAHPQVDSTLTINPQQAAEIDARLAQAGVVTTDGKADWRGICAAYQIQRKGQLPAVHLEDLRQRIDKKHASILPPAAQPATATA